MERITMKLLLCCIFLGAIWEANGASNIALGPKKKVVVAAAPPPPSEAILSRKRRAKGGIKPSPPSPSPPSPSPSPSPTPAGCNTFSTPLLNRVEFRQMSLSQISSFQNALQSMKNSGTYKDFVDMRQSAAGVDNGAGFLAWNREFLFQFEKALRDRGYSSGLPYWDPILDSNLPNPTDSILWDSLLAGHSSFIQSSNPGTGCSGVLNRNVGAAGSLLDSGTKQTLQSKSCYRDFTCPLNCFLETAVNANLNYVGGDMATANCKANDPLYFLLHAHIDGLWEPLRKAHGSTDYPDTDSAAGGVNHAWNKNMDGLEKYNAEGLSNYYTNFYYGYNTMPSDINCSSDSDCGSSSSLLFCHNGQCISKIRVNGNCSGFGNNACYCGQRSKKNRCTSNSCRC